MHFMPEWKIYVSTLKMVEKVSEFLAEIPGGVRALWEFDNSNPSDIIHLQ